MLTYLPARIHVRFVYLVIMSYGNVSEAAIASYVKLLRRLENSRDSNPINNVWHDVKEWVRVGQRIANTS